MRSSLTVLALLLSLLTSSCRKEFAATVTEVVDGDTLVVQEIATTKRIRLFGIDCPEYNQHFGKEARLFTARLALSQTVRIEPVDLDPHGRIVARVYLMPGERYLNAEIVSAGYAWWFRKYAPHEKVLERMEREARNARRGLWQTPNPREPWNFRRRENEKPRNQRPNSPNATAPLG